MGFSKASLLIGLLFSAALLVSARELSETAEEKDSVEESKYHGGGYHRYPRGHYHHPYHGGYRHYPPTTERKTLESSDVKPDYYHHYGGYRPRHHGGYHGGHGGHYPPQGKEGEKGN